VLFTRAGLRRLRLRTGELERECAALREALRALQGEEKALQAEKRAVEAQIAAVREQCAAVMLLKFGKPIDVEALDKATAASAQSLASIADEQAGLERRAEADLAARRARLALLQEALTRLTRAHTGALEAAASLSARLEALEGELSGRVDTGLNAVALHASLGTPLATAVAQGRLGAGSLSALRPMMAAATKRALAAGADAANLPAAVTQGLTLSAKAGGGGGGGGGADDSVARAQEAAERARLAQLVAHQSATLEGLRAQLAVLRTKSEAAATEVFARSQGLSGTSLAATAFVRAVPPPRAPEAAGGGGGGEGGGALGPIAGRASLSVRTMVAPVFESTVKARKAK